jgi:hypothetical protein
MQPGRFFVLCLLLFGLNAQSAVAQVEPSDRTASASEGAFLEELRQRAAVVSVVLQDEGSPVTQELGEAPVFRYSDARREILDAALWSYGGAGRPAALMKIETYKIDRGSKWVYCIASLSGDLIEATWNDGARFQSTEPGLELQAIPDGPQPGPTAGTRLLQLKRLTERFTAVIQNGEDNREPMRLMPTPICRYSDAEAGLIDGAVFGYTMGTNPDVLLVIELHESDSGDAEWRCGAAGMTSAGFAVKLDQNDILVQEFDPSISGQPRAYARWMWHRVIEQ